MRGVIMWLDKLKEMKKRSGKTSKQIADETGVPKSTIDKLFAGQTKEPYVSSTKLIVNCLGYTLDDLFCRNNINRFEFNEHEQDLVIAYRQKPEMQPAVDKLLGIDNTETVRVLRAARSNDNRHIGYIEISKEKLELLENAPSVEDEVDL